MAKRTAKDNLYKKGVDTLSQHMTLRRTRTLDEIVKGLRQLLSVDPVIEEINPEEALEFLDAIEENIASEREEMKEALTEAEDELKDLEKSKGEELTELQNDYDELMKKTDFDLQIGTIEYRSPGIMDDMIMDALSEAYDLLTPMEIIDRLKVRKLKAV